MLQLNNDAAYLNVKRIMNGCGYILASDHEHDAQNDKNSPSDKEDAFPLTPCSHSLLMHPIPFLCVEVMLNPLGDRCTLIADHLFGDDAVFSYIALGDRFQDSRDISRRDSRTGALELEHI